MTLASRGLLKGPEKVEKVQLPPEKLSSIVLDLKRNLHKYYQRRGMSPKLDEQWRVFFNTVDEDASGRLDFSELKEAVKVLGVQLDDESLRGCSRRPTKTVRERSPSTSSSTASTNWSWRRGRTCRTRKSYCYKELYQC